MSRGVTAKAFETKSRYRSAKENYKTKFNSQISLVVLLLVLFLGAKAPTNPTNNGLAKENVLKNLSIRKNI